MSDYEKHSVRGVRFESGKPSYGRKNGNKDRDRHGYGEKGDYKKREYSGKDGYKKPYGDKDGYKKREYSDKDGYKKPYGGKDGYKKPYGDKGGYKKPYDDRDERFGDYKESRKHKKYDEESVRRNSFDEKRSAEAEHAVREDELPFLIMGRNAVREAIKSGRSIDKILVIPERDGSLGEILGMARDRNILIQEEKREKLDELCMPFGHGEKTGNHQGIVARVPGAEYVSLEDILDYAKERNEAPFILLLDGITDPYNFGSMIRSAECAGIHGIVIPKRRSATLTSSAVKVSAGAASHMRIAKVPNIANAIDRLHENNVWVAGADMEGKSMYETDMKGAMAIVIGSEDEGLSALVRKKCDYIISAPIKGNIDSLNAAVASAVLMYEKVRQDTQS